MRYNTQSGVMARILGSLLLTIFLSFSVYGYAQYFENYAVNDDGRWREGVSGHSISDRLLFNGVGLPLTKDIDDDGIIEIIVFDDDRLNILYNNRGTLDIKETITDVDLNSVQSAILYDIDEDGYDEVVFSSTKFVYVVSFDNDVINLDHKWQYESTGRSSVVSCRSGAHCMLVYVEDHAWTTGVRSAYARPFNSAGFTESATSIGSVNGGGFTYNRMCFPGLREVSIVEMEGDDDPNGEDFVVSYFSISPTSGSTTYFINSITTNVSDNIINNDLTTIGIWSGIYPGALSGGSCVTGSSKTAISQVTSAVPIKFEGTDNSDLEYVFAYMVSSNNYKLYVYDTAGSYVDRFPDTFDQEGQIVSNVFLADVFPDTDLNDLCVFGFNDASSVIKTLCGTSSTADSATNTREFYMDVDDYPEINFTISDEIYIYNRAVHSSQQKDNPIVDDQGVFNPSEFITPYGVLSIDADSWDENPTLTSKDADMLLSYHVRGEEGALLSLKTKNVLDSDLIFLTDDAIYLHDNGDVNLAGWISDIRIDPCTELNDSAVSWKNGTDVEFQIIGVDPEFDRVSARVTLYEGLNDVDVPEELTPYLWSVQEVESDATLDNKLESIGAEDNSDIFDTAVLLRGVDFEDTYVDSMNLSIDGLKNNPNLRSFVYDIYICPSSATSLTSDPDMFFSCAETETIILNDVDLSVLIGTSIGEVNIPFDDPYLMDSSYTNYIIVFEYVSGTISDDTYELDVDTAPTSNLIKRNTRTPPSTIVSTDLYPSILGIELLNDYKYSVEVNTGWSSYVNVGSPILREFTGSQVQFITPSADFVVELRDEENPSEIDSYTGSFSVQTTGVTKGDCSNTLRFDDPYAPPEEGDDEDADRERIENSTLTKSIDDLDRVTGLNLGRAVFWLIIMALAGGMMWVYGSRDSPKMTAGVIGFVEVLLLIIGVKMAFLSAGLIIIFIVLIGGGLAFFIGKVVVGGG